MFKRFFLIALVLAGCKTTAICKTEEHIADVVGSALAVTLECDHPDAVTADMLYVVQSQKMCSAPQSTGPIATIVCPFLASYVVSKVADQIPARWGCHATNAKAKATLLLTTGCMALPF